VWDRWNDTGTGSAPLSHDMPCPRCRHAPHVYLACGDGCDCPTMRPGSPPHDVIEALGGPTATAC
jgi:hypothetical protein